MIADLDVVVAKAAWRQPPPGYPQPSKCGRRFGIAQSGDTTTVLARSYF
jgi:hypothetical protein